METITEFLIDWGYWGLFLSALIAGSVLPFSSEAAGQYFQPVDVFGIVVQVACYLEAKLACGAKNE